MLIVNLHLFTACNTLQQFYRVRTKRSDIGPTPSRYKAQGGLIYKGGPYNETIGSGLYVIRTSRFFKTLVCLITVIRTGPFNRGNTVSKNNHLCSCQRKQSMFEDVFLIMEFWNLLIL